MNRGSKQLPEDSQWESTARSLKVLVRTTAIGAAVCVILGGSERGTHYLDPIGKALFWTGTMFGTLFSFNQDVLRLPSGRLLATGMIAADFSMMFFFFGRLDGWTFVTLTPVCFMEALILVSFSCSFGSDTPTLGIEHQAQIQDSEGKSMRFWMAARRSYAVPQTDRGK